MNRRRRVEVEGGVHHVMNRGVNRQLIFFGDADRVEFGRRLVALHDDFGVDTLAYCLMPNHYHLLVRVPSGELSAAMQSLGCNYVRHTNDRVGRDGPLFRARFHSIPVATDRYLVAVARYIHRNPLDLAGVDTPARYRWSSYRAYLGHRSPAPFLDTSTLLSCFGHETEALATMTEGAAGSLDLGPIAETDVDQAVEFAFAIDDLTGTDEGGRSRVDRTLRLLLSDRGFPARTDDDRSIDAVRAARYRARKRLVNDPALRRTLDHALGLLDAA